MKSLLVAINRSAPSTAQAPYPELVVGCTVTVLPPPPPPDSLDDSEEDVVDDSEEDVCMDED